MDGPEVTIMPTLRVGAALPDPPFELLTKEGPAGFDIALMKQTMIRRQDGVSMAEVMVAMLILAVGSLAVLNLISASANSSYRNEQTS